MSHAPTTAPLFISLLLSGGGPELFRALELLIVLLLLVALLLIVELLDVVLRGAAVVTVVVATAVVVGTTVVDAVVVAVVVSVALVVTLVVVVSVVPFAVVVVVSVTAAGETLGGVPACCWRPSAMLGTFAFRAPKSGIAAFDLTDLGAFAALATPSASVSATDAVLGDAAAGPDSAFRVFGIHPDAAVESPCPALTFPVLCIVEVSPAPSTATIRAIATSITLI